MNPATSPLNIIDYAITDFELKFIAPEEKENIDFKNYDLNIDFGINNDDFLRVYI